MDKLIWYDNDGGIMCRRGYEVALARLASYEATGLMPEQVANAKVIIESAFAMMHRKPNESESCWLLMEKGALWCCLPANTAIHCTALKWKDLSKNHYPDSFLPPRYTSHHNHIRKNYRGETNGFLASELGKTMFLSLEEAERALEERKNG